MSRGTPARQVRMPDALWQAVQLRAAARGTDASAVTRRLLSEWAAQDEGIESMSQNQTDATGPEHDDKKAAPCNCPKCLYQSRPGRTYEAREAAL